MKTGINIKKKYESWKRDDRIALDKDFSSNNVDSVRNWLQRTSHDFFGLKATAPNKLSLCSKKKIRSMLIDLFIQALPIECFSIPVLYCSPTIIHWAAASNITSIIDAAIEYKLDLEKEDVIHRTPLYLSIAAGKSFEIASRLVEKGHVNVNNIRHNPLHAAILINNLKIVQLLLSNGAEQISDREHAKTPYDFAVFRLKCIEQEKMYRPRKDFEEINKITNLLKKVSALIDEFDKRSGSFTPSYNQKISSLDLAIKEEPEIFAQSKSRKFSM